MALAAPEDGAPAVTRVTTTGAVLTRRPCRSRAEESPLSRAIEMAKVAMKVWSDRAAMVAVEASASSRG